MKNWNLTEMIPLRGQEGYQTCVSLLLGIMVNVAEKMCKMAMRFMSGYILIALSAHL
jgi:hypothetical protein